MTTSIAFRRERLSRSRMGFPPSVVYLFMFSHVFSVGRLECVRPATLGVPFLFPWDVFRLVLSWNALLPKRCLQGLHTRTNMAPFFPSFSKTTAWHCEA